MTENNESWYNQRKTNQENTVNDEIPNNGGKNSLILFFVLTMIVAISAAVIYHFYITPKIEGDEARSNLKNLISLKGEIRPINNSLTTYDKQSIDTANVNQKALGIADITTEPAGIYFGNGKGRTEQKRIVEFYGDFKTQQSRDFIMMNRNTITSMIENGVIEFRFHPVPTGDAYSMYASEALAESVVTSPETTWDLLLELYKQSYNLDTDKPEEVMDLVIKSVENRKAKDINAESIRNGTFVSWFLGIGDDPKLESGFRIPAIYVNDILLKNDEVNINNSDEFRKAVLENG